MSAPNRVNKIVYELPTLLKDSIEYVVLIFLLYSLLFSVTLYSFTTPVTGLCEGKRVSGPSVSLSDDIVK